VSTLDVVSCESDVAFQVSFEGEEPQLCLRAEHFGGCAAYLKQWADHQTLADAVDDAVANGGMSPSRSCFSMD
jgi:hypothetical protein